MTAYPTWFGPEEQPLFGWLHVPDGGRARGAVVCCPPLGVEAVAAHRAFRELALSLEAAGYAVLRFDYAGTGDSSGAGLASGAHDGGEPPRLADWLASIGTAVEYLRGCGLSRVGVVGMRLGALLAARVAGTVEAAVLWDPCSSGRAFVREQQLLRESSIGTEVRPRTAPAEGDAEILGGVWPAPLVADLRPLDLVSAARAGVAPRTLVLTRPETVVPEKWTAALNGRTQWGVARGQAELLDVTADLAELPTATISVVCWWLARALDGPAESVDPLLRSTAEVTVQDVRVREQLVELGPIGLFGVLTTPVEGPVAESTLVLTNAGRIDHTGPARLWVDRARAYAAAGIPVLRVDLSGLGDSPTHPGQRRDIPHPYEALQDMADIAAALPALVGRPTEVVLSGLCSGAYHAIEGALAGHAQGVVAVNPLLGFEPPRPSSEVAAATPIRPTFERLRHHEWLVRFAEYRLSPIVWWWLDLLRIQRHPAHGLQELAARGVPTFVLCGDDEARPFLRRARRPMKRLARGTAVDFELVPAIDHTLYGAEARERAVAVLDEHVLTHYAPPANPDALRFHTISDASTRTPPRSRRRSAVIEAAPVNSRLAVIAIIALFGLAEEYLGQQLGRAHADGPAWGLFVLGVALTYVPSAWRLLARGVPRSERLAVALLLTALLAASNLMLGPRVFTGFDELAHQVTLWQLSQGHSLTAASAALPAHAGHPGVELATLAGHWLTGVPVVVSAIAVAVLGRLLLVLMVFLLVERLLGSSRSAAIAVVACTCTPQFYAFNAPHAFQTIGLTFAVGAAYATARAMAARRGRRWGLLALAALCLAGVVLCGALLGVVTVGGLLLAALLLVVLRRPAARVVVLVAATGLVLLALWTALVATRFFAPATPGLRHRVVVQLFGSGVPAQLHSAADRGAPLWQQLAIPGAALLVFLVLLLNRRLLGRVRPAALALLALVAFGATTAVSAGPGWSSTPGHQPRLSAARGVDPVSVAAAAWVGELTPAGTRLATDPVNGTLQAGIGRADVTTRATALLGGAWTSADAAIVRRDRLRLVVVDSRVGGAGAALAGVSGVATVYVDGPLRIYDVSRLAGLPPVAQGTQPGPLPAISGALHRLAGWDWQLCLLAGLTLLLWVRRPRRMLRELDGVVDRWLVGGVLALGGALALVPTRLSVRPLALGLLGGLAVCALVARWFGRGRGSQVPAVEVLPVSPETAYPETVFPETEVPPEPSRLARLLEGKGLLGRFAYLLLTQFFVVSFGIGYWIVTAKLVPAQSVGLAAAAVSAATFISALAIVGVASLVLVELIGVGHSERRVLLGTGVAVAGGATALLCGLLWLIAWFALPHLGGSFGHLIHDPVDAGLMIAGATATTMGSIFDAASISLRRSRVQLLRNIVMAGLRVGIVAVLVELGVTSATGLLAAWAGSISVSLLFCPGRLTPRFGGDRLTLPAGRQMVYRFAMSALRHHSLNLAITSVAFFLPLLAAVLLAPRDYAYFAVAQLVSSTVMLVPAALAMSLFAETVGDERLLRQHIRRTLPIGLGCSALVLAFFEPGAQLVLRIFGPEYSVHGTTTLRILLLGGMSYVVKDHYVAIRRAQGRLGNAARTVAVATFVEATLTAVGGALGGVDGLCAFWVGATVLEAGYFAPVVLRVIREPKQPAPVTASAPLLGAFAD